MSDYKTSGLLTDEQIKSHEWHLEVVREHEQYTGQEVLRINGSEEFARAIESATRAPLLAEIERLTKALEKYEADDVQYMVKLERLTAELDEAKRGQAGALDLVSRIRWAVGDHGARMQPELIEYLKQMRKQAEKRDAWEEALRQVEEEMPDGYCVTLEMSPGDWSLTAHTDEGEPIRIDDYESTEEFIREAVEAAKAHHARKESTNG